MSIIIYVFRVQYYRWKTSSSQAIILAKIKKTFKNKEQFEKQILYVNICLF